MVFKLSREVQTLLYVHKIAIPAAPAASLIELAAACLSEVRHRGVFNLENAPGIITAYIACSIRGKERRKTTHDH